MKKMIALLPLPLALAFGLTACGGEKEMENAAQAETAPATEAKVNPSAPPQPTEPAQQLAAAAEAKPADANGTHPGKAVHDAHCISCHDTGVYTRADRKMQDFAMLSAQVRRCDANIGSQLFDEDMDKIADYLNTAFYQFPKE